MDLEIMAASLRKEMGQIIRLLEDSAILGNSEGVFLYIGKLAKIQAILDELENVPMEWSNEEEE